MRRFWVVKFALRAAVLAVALLTAACMAGAPTPIGPATKAPTPMPPSGKGIVLPTREVAAPTQAPQPTIAASTASPATPTPALTVTMSQPVTATRAVTIALEGPVWKMVSYLDRQGKTVNALPESEVTAQFREGQVLGKDGCNQYTGTYKATDMVLTIRLGATTTMACEQKLMDQAQAYAAALSSAATYQITGDRLQITGGGGKVVVTFVASAPTVGPAPAVADTQPLTPTVRITGVTTVTIPLEGTLWKLTALADGRGNMAPVVAGVEITALFQGGRVTGNAGCNNYAATYRLTGSSLTVSAPAATSRKACAQPIMQQERNYLAALGRTVAHKIEGNRLELRNSSAALLASFTATRPAITATATALPVPTRPLTPTVTVSPTRTVTPTVVASPMPTPTPVAAAIQAGRQLTHTLWQWTYFVTPLEVKAIATPARYAVVFRPDGTVEITADCNKATGTYRLEATRLQMQVSATTRVACGSDSLSNQFLDNLARAVLYFLDGDALYIELLADGGIMKFANAGPVR